MGDTAVLTYISHGVLYKLKLTATFAPKYSLAGSSGCRILATEMASADQDEVNEVANSAGRDRRRRRGAMGTTYE
jgi:hypothetical protein